MARVCACHKIRSRCSPYLDNEQIIMVETRFAIGGNDETTMLLWLTGVSAPNDYSRKRTFSKCHPSEYTAPFIGKELSLY
jgi:hypothetical protein